MRYATAITKNVQEYQLATMDLGTRSLGVEGMCLVHGRAGEGKTTATAFLVNQTNGVFVRAHATWTVTSMLAALLHEVGAPPMPRRQHMLDFLVQHLSETGRTLFIDEADYLCRHIDMLDTVRDIYDDTRVPVVLIGMEALPRKLATHARLRRRIMQEVVFNGLDLEDTDTVAQAVCEIDIAEDLLTHLHQEAKGNIGLVVNGLAAVERLANSNGQDGMTRAQWGERPFFFGAGGTRSRRS